jgi:hypothetical protein
MHAPAPRRRRRHAARRRRRARARGGHTRLVSSMGYTVRTVGPGWLAIKIQLAACMQRRRGESQPAAGHNSRPSAGAAGGHKGELLVGQTISDL